MNIEETPVKKTARARLLRSKDPAAKRPRTRHVNLECSYGSCKLRFDTRAELTAHSLTHLADAPGQVTCTAPGCTETFTSLKDRSAHLRTHHSAIPRPHVCPVIGCELAFSAEHQLVSHGKVHSAVRPFKCSHPGCLKTFRTNSNMHSHLKSHISKEERIKLVCGEQCDDGTRCTTECFRPEDLTKHRKNVHQGIVAYACMWEGCGKTFCAFGAYDRHMATHTKKTAYPCTAPGCESAFLDLDKLKIHLRLHHGAPLLKCPEDNCDFETAYAESVCRHRSGMHGIGPRCTHVFSDGTPCPEAERDSTRFCVRHHPDWVKSAAGASKMACEVWDLYERENGVKLQHMHYDPREKAPVGSEPRVPELGRCRADAAIVGDLERRLLYFHGTPFHGVPPSHPEHLTGRSHINKTYKQLYNATMKMQYACTAAGYTVYMLWQVDYARYKRDLRDGPVFVRDYFQVLRPGDLPVVDMDADEEDPEDLREIWDTNFAR